MIGRVEVVAVVSGRPAGQVRDLLGVPGVVVVGLYGLAEGEGRERIESALGEVERVAGLVPGAWVEDKGASLAVHFRAAADPARAAILLRQSVRAAADAHGLSFLEGKMVVEAAAGPIPGKGAVVRDLANQHALDACLYAGDDRPDLEAFAALDELAAEGCTAIRVAVRTEETPQELLAAADVVVDRPAGLLRFLSDL